LVDVSTSLTSIPALHPSARNLGRHTVLCGLEADPSLFRPCNLRQRLIALDQLDTAFGAFAPQQSTTLTDSRIYQRANALRARLEAVNADLYQSLRSAILQGSQPPTLSHWLQYPAPSNHSQIPTPGMDFDWRDELLSGVLQLPEPNQPEEQYWQRASEMVPYQPTPVRHILHLLAATALTQEDVFVDLGSGLGHVPLMVSMMTKARSLGVEVQPAYVASAQQCAQSLHLSRVEFLSRDAREADMSGGTVFYLYSPFKGSILTAVLNALRREAAHRPIKICSLGPCTRTLANQTWLKARTLPDTRHITLFNSQ